MSVDWRELADRALEASVVGSFSKLGYLARERMFRWVPLDAYSAAGRVVAVTGATSGLGLAAAHQLAAIDADVLLLGRSEDKLEAARAEIVSDTGNEAVRTHRGDLSSLADVRSLAESLREAEPGLDVLIHNAGALFDQQRESVDGLELTFATMVVGPTLLTELLAPMLGRSRDGRVVIVSSGGMYTQRLDVAELEHPSAYRGTTAYARAKRAQVVLGEEWARRWAGDFVVHSMHPGWAATPGVTASLPAFDTVMRPLLRTAEQGADTMVWLAVADEAAQSSGRFWLDRRPRATHKLARTHDRVGERTRLLDRLGQIVRTGS